MIFVRSICRLRRRAPLRQKLLGFAVMMPYSFAEATRFGIHTSMILTIFLEFVQDSCRKIAYAPSFGVMEIPHRCQQRLRKAIAPFRYVSVREKRGAEIVRELTGKQVMVAVDPTLLVSMAHWQTLAKPIDSEQKVPVLLFPQ